MIKKYNDGACAITSHGVWLPGLYDLREIKCRKAKRGVS